MSKPAGFTPPQRSNVGRTGAVSMEMLQSWSSKIGAGAIVDLSATSRTVANNTTQVVNWARALHDSHGFWSSAAPGRLTIPQGLDGVYACSGVVDWETAQSTGIRQQLLTINLTSGSIGKSTQFAGYSGPELYPIPSHSYMPLRAGNYIQVSVRQTNTPLAAMEYGNTDDTYFSLVRIGDLASNEP